MGFLKRSELNVKRSVEDARHWLVDHIEKPIVQFLRQFNENLFKNESPATQSEGDSTNNE